MTKIFILFCFYNGGLIAQNNSSIILNTINELKLYKNVQQGLEVNVTGYYDKTDLAGGTYYCINKLEAVKSENYYIESNNPNFLWKRIIKENNLDVRSFGAVGNGIADDSKSIQIALNLAKVYMMPVLLSQVSKSKPTIYFTNKTSLIIDYGVCLLGNGLSNTKIYYNGTNSAIEIGDKNAKELQYGTRIKDISIILLNKKGIGLHLYNTCGALCEDLYIEGVIEKGRENIAVLIDGANSSSFFNSFQNIICNHTQTGFKLIGSVPSHISTASIFLNCSVLSDFYPNSIGFYFSSFCGHGSNIIGGNLEAIDKGIYFEKEAAPLTINGLRFEANNVDIEFGESQIGCTFIGCIGIRNILKKDNSMIGKNSFVGCFKSDGTVFNNRSNTLEIHSTELTDNPLKIYGLQNNQKLNPLKDNREVIKFSITNDGEINKLNGEEVKITCGTGSPEGKVVAKVGSLYLNTLGGSGTTLYIKETGVGATGWKSK